MDGKVYLTKDAVMQETTFKATYPNWKCLKSVRENMEQLGSLVLHNRDGWG